MSHEGKLRRGKEYYNMRDRDGNIPKGVTENSDKMKDLDFYLKSLEPKKKEKKKAVGAEDAKPVEKAAPKKEEAKEAPKEEAK